MDLLKMHPMARKMTVHNEAFAKAIENGEAESAREHLQEIKKFADFLEEDLHFVMKKAATVVVSPESGWQQQSPIIKFNETGSKFDPSQRGSQLPGTIIPARTNAMMKKARGTFGRRVERGN
jgi:hypothetical protein